MLDRYIYMCFHQMHIPRFSFSSSCFRVLKRFFAATSVQTLIISDNGSQFISNETQSFVNNRGTKCQFNLASAPWWVGMFERMMRSMKRCLRELLGRSRVDYEQLLTLLSEIQTIINNRPLTFLYNELQKKHSKASVIWQENQFRKYLEQHQFQQ